MDLSIENGDFSVRYVELPRSMSPSPGCTRPEARPQGQVFAATPAFKAAAHLGKTLSYMVLLWLYYGFNMVLSWFYYGLYIQ